jgi:hypothetical protein
MNRYAASLHLRCFGAKIIHVLQKSVCNFSALHHFVSGSLGNSDGMFII